MLSFRLILFVGVAGFCLWGLFNLLDNLKQPELLRSPKVVVVKGCETTESDEAKKLCPQLYCEKAVLDSKQVALASRFTVLADETDASGSHLIGGTVVHEGKQRSFTCTMRQNTVVTSQVLDDSKR